MLGDHHETFFRDVNPVAFRLIVLSYDDGGLRTSTKRLVIDVQVFFVQGEPSATMSLKTGRLRINALIGEMAPAFTSWGFG